MQFLVHYFQDKILGDQQGLCGLFMPLRVTCTLFGRKEKMNEKVNILVLNLSVWISQTNQWLLGCVAFLIMSQWSSMKECKEGSHLEVPVLRALPKWTQCECNSLETYVHVCYLFDHEPVVLHGWMPTKISCGSACALSFSQLDTVFKCDRNAREIYASVLISFPLDVFVCVCVWANASDE